MSPAKARFRLLQGGCRAVARSEVLARIRTRWGDAAVEEVRDRIEKGTDQEAEAWLRRSAYFLDLAAMLDLGCELPVLPLRVHDLLRLLTRHRDLAMSFVLLQVPAYPQDSRQAGRGAPWLEDLPAARDARKHLYAYGWLIVGCPQPEQGAALWQSVRRGSGIRASRYELAPGRTRVPSPLYMPNTKI